MIFRASALHTAHPHSRGENRVPRAFDGFEVGSSPLTRGKPLRVRRAVQHQGLIPTHAGKTRGPGCGMRAGQAHPHSRGENRASLRTSGRTLGSSPLTRGKRGDESAFAGGGGLIPTHAGKTPMMPPTPCPWRAHPHSRGENPSRSDWLVGGTGSSPLTRGKQVEARAQARDHGLIPTHAGKTLDVKIAAFRLRAHPHSRGENVALAEGVGPTMGSSPLTRGKP